MDEALYILKKYWRFSKFRPLQDEIIKSVLEGQDVLALMPTGGGKSICFQVPALVKEGICIVVSPLIALIKDQVEQLQKREIKAAAIYAGISKKEIDLILDNCIYGNYKFLYVSPERLKTDLFRERLKKMPVNLLAIDEAHCISQWGHDFRPSYLEIAEIKSYLPEGTNIIALTATATTEVQADILKFLELKNPQVFVKSFARENLSYVVRRTDNKEQQMERVLNNVPGSSVVYVSTRKATAHWAKIVSNWNIKAQYYHGGMGAVERNVRQKDWMMNKSRVMIATNAFGMGIDKPDVRTVVHAELPNNLESYYQEAGRAGRDEKRAYAVLFYDKLDLEQLMEKIQSAYPEKDYLKHVYQCLANYFKLAVGSGEGQVFPFTVKEFAKQYNLDVLKTFHAIKRLQDQELIHLNEAFFQPSRVAFTVGKEDLYKFQVANAKLDPLIKSILRIYGGEAYQSFVRINEKELAEYLKTSESQLVIQLRYLHQQNILFYEEQKNQPELIFLLPRQNVSHLPINWKQLQKRKEVEEKKASALIKYIQNDKRCRTLQLLDYFGEVSDEACGNCDVCLKKKKDASFEKSGIVKDIKRLLTANPMTINELTSKINESDEKRVVLLVREMLDQGILAYDEQFRLVVS
ncbi:MAG: RecQ family ATP-dependent DNA helicase [Candidatus Cyclobacteriaceae bacterium M2_1C_046]